MTNNLAPIRNTGQFLHLLKREKQVVEINHPVSADQEIAEIHRRVIAAGGPALLFTNVQGSNFPVLTNLFGTRQRTELAFGSRPTQFVADAARMVHEAMPPTPKSLWPFRHMVPQALKIGMKQVRQAPVMEELQSPPRLTELPLLKLWPQDGGHFVTLPLVYTEDPESGKSNLGMYRIQRYTNKTTGIHWQIGKGGGFHYHKAEQVGDALPVSIFIGGPPALMLSAIAPLPEDVPELLLASLLQGGKLKTARSAKTPHPLLAEAEFALIGRVPPRKRHPEGPFGDHYGYYSLKHPYPIFQCKAVYHRKNAIYPATVVGKPRQEDFYIGDYLQELLSPLFPIVMPSVKDLWSYGETGFHSLAAAVVKDRYPREALMSAFRILGEGQLALTKFLLLLDTPMDLRDFRKVLKHILERVNWETDLYIFSNLSMDTLDYTGPEVNKGSKGVIAALGDPVRQLPRAFSGNLPRPFTNAEVFVPGCLVVDGPDYQSDPEAAQKLAKKKNLKDWPLIILCDEAKSCTRSEINFLWTVFTRFEPAADIHAKSAQVIRSHIAYTGPLVIDARTKPWYPGTVEPDKVIAKKVTEDWKKYFPGGMEMGSDEV